MENLIKEIMDELFVIDPGLKKYQKELEATMAKMIANKPQDKFDEKFKEELKMKLLVRAEELEKEKSVRPSLWKNLVFWRGVSLAAAAAVFVLAVVVPAIQSGKFVLPNFKSNGSLSFIAGTMRVEEAGERAFGDLASSSQSLTNLEESAALSDASFGAPAPAVVPKTPSSTSHEVAGLGGGSGTNVSMPNVKMMPPEYMTKYNYVYVGEEFSLPEVSEVAVLKRLKTFGSENLNSVLDKISFGIFDANKLSNVKVQNLSLVEDRDGGYIVDFNPYEGTISIYENWQKSVPVYYEALPRLQESNVPSDEKLIAAANDFLFLYGISRGNYGAPKVSQSERLGYAEDQKAEDQKGDIWISDTMTVQYPLLLDGKAAWEQGGYSQAGFSVNINIRTMKITGLYGLAMQNYQSSNYAAETDKERLMKLALQGDIWPQATYPTESFKVKEVEIKISTPRIEYMRYWKYDGTQSHELFVPALVFPIVDKTQVDNYFNKEVVVIPLVKEILDNVSAEARDGVPPPVLLPSEPMTEPAMPVPVDIDSVREE